MKKVTKNIGIYVIIFGLVLAMVWFYNSDAPKEEKEIKTSTRQEGGKHQCDGDEDDG